MKQCIIGILAAIAAVPAFCEMRKNAPADPSPPRRVVIAYASLAKLWHLAGGTAVGVPSLPAANALPEPMRGLPSTGTAAVPNAEAIAALRPDLVLLNGASPRHRACGELLRGMGIEVLFAEYKNYHDFTRLLETFAVLNGKTTAELPEAERVVADVRAVCERAAALSPPRCAVIFAAASGFSLETPDTNTGGMVEMLGGRNLLKRSGSGRIHFSFEQLILEDPDVILIVTMGDEAALKTKFEREFCAHPAWKDLRAARSGRVHFLAPELFLYMPGPEYPKAFRQLAALLYPEVQW